MNPNLNQEKKLWKKGYRYIAGLDEAGRGPLAGPVVAGAVVITTAKIKNQKSKIKNILREIKDSKKLSQKKRERLYKLITENQNIEWGIGRVSEKIIDKINILEATKLAMERAVTNLEKKLKKRKIQKIRDRGNFASIDFLIVDGKMALRTEILQKAIVKADEKVFSCAAASIIAKVRRDRIMGLEHKKYPQYGFERHKGYPTKHHYKMLKKYGPCPIHRKSFRLRCA